MSRSPRRGGAGLSSGRRVALRTDAYFCGVMVASGVIAAEPATRGSEPQRPHRAARHVSHSCVTRMARISAMNGGAARRHRGATGPRSYTRMTEKHYAHLAPSYVKDTISANALVLGISAEASVTRLTTRPTSSDHRCLGAHSNCRTRSCLPSRPPQSMSMRSTDFTGIEAIVGRELKGLERGTHIDRPSLRQARDRSSSPVRRFSRADLRAQCSAVGRATCG